MAVTPVHGVAVKSTVFIDSILSAMIPSPNDDTRCLLAISLIYSLVHNQGEFLCSNPMYSCSEVCVYMYVCFFHRCELKVTGSLFP